jgi:hypothetical protein
LRRPASICLPLLPSPPQPNALDYCIVLDLNHGCCAGPRRVGEQQCVRYLWLWAVLFGAADGGVQPGGQGQRCQQDLLELCASRCVCIQGQAAAGQLWCSGHVVPGGQQQLQLLSYLAKCTVQLASSKGRHRRSYPIKHWRGRLARPGPSQPLGQQRPPVPGN